MRRHREERRNGAWTACGLASGLALLLAGCANSFGHPSVDSARLALQVRADLQPIEDCGWTWFLDERKSEFWLFAPPAVPGYPIGVRLSMRFSGDRAWLDMSYRCEGERSACALFDQEARALHGLMRAALHAPPPLGPPQKPAFNRDCGAFPGLSY